MPALLQPHRQLAAGGRLARALQAGHQDHRRRLRRKLEPRRILAQQRHQLVVNDLDDLLGRRKRRQNLGPDRLLANMLDQVLHHIQVHVGFQQRHANLAQRLADVLFGQHALSTQVFKGALQLLCQILKHDFPDPFSWSPSPSSVSRANSAEHMRA